MRVRSILAASCLLSMLTTSPALAWNGVQGGTGHSDPGRGRGSDVSAAGGEITSRRGVFGYRAPDRGIDINSLRGRFTPGRSGPSRGIGGSRSGGEDGNGSHGSSH